MSGNSDFVIPARLPLDRNRTNHEVSREWGILQRIGPWERERIRPSVRTRPCVVLREDHTRSAQGVEFLEALA